MSPAGPDLERICVFGAGAVGGNLAAHLARDPSRDVSVVARGAHLQAIARHGLTLRRPDGTELVAHPRRVTDRSMDLGVQDLVVVTLKAPALPGAAQAISRLIDDDTVVVCATNGVPWWWSDGVTHDRPILPSLDPDGALAALIGTERVVAAVVRSSNEVVAPGVVLHSGGNSWILGAPVSGQTDRVRRVVEVFRAADIGAEPTSDIRRVVWDKLLANISSAPVCALTQRFSGDVRATPELADVQRRLWRECADVGRSLGIEVGGLFDDVPVPPARSRASMLQDVLTGRPIEVEAILGAPQALARRGGIATPTLDVVAALLRGLDASSLRRSESPA